MGAAVALAGAARLGSAAAAPACTITWDGGAVPASTAWATAANWSGDVLPGAADHVCIPAGATVVHSTGTTSILSLQSQGALTLSGGTLSLTDTTVGNESNAVSIVQSNGTLGGAATLIVSSSYQWSFGTQTGAGETRIGVGATLTRTGGSTVALTQRTLRNGGTVTVTGTGAIQAGTGARIVNAVGATFDLQADSSVFSEGRPARGSRTPARSGRAPAPPPPQSRSSSTTTARSRRAQAPLRFPEATGRGRRPAASAGRARPVSSTSRRARGISTPARASRVGSNCRQGHSMWRPERRCRRRPGRPRPSSEAR